MQLNHALMRAVFEKTAQAAIPTPSPTEIANLATMSPAHTPILGAEPVRSAPTALDDFMTSWYSLRGTKVTPSDIAKAKAVIAGAEARINKKDVDIWPRGGGVPRVLVPVQDLSPQAILGAGYTPGGMAIPELGQVNFTTWRKPYTYQHLHRHPQFWTMHRDKYPSMGQAFRGETTPGKGGTGAAHVANEGVPGLVSYIRAATGGGRDFTDGSKPRFSLFRALGSNAPRSRQEFLTRIHDFGDYDVAGARGRTGIRLGAGAAALGVSVITALAIRAHLRRKMEQALREQQQIPQPL